MLYKNLITLVLIASLSACSEDSIQETIEDTIQESIEDAQDSVDDAVEDAQDSVDDAIEDAQDSVDDIEDDIEDVIGDLDGSDDEESDGCTAPYILAGTTGMSNSDKDEGPEKATDSDDSTYWASEGTDQELILDLGSDKSFAALQVMWLKSNERSAYYDIATSTDNITWSNAFDEQQTSLSTDAAEFEVVNLNEPVTARYIKYSGQGNSASGSTWNSIIEIQAFSCALTDTVIVPEEPEEEKDPTVIGDDTIDQCDALGQMLYNGTCSAYTEVYEEEHGILDEGAYLVSSDPLEMSFDALAAQHVTDNGNGWRHELKIKSSGDYRVAMTEVYELFKAKITVNLDNGAKTIVAQHHASDTGTITKLYVADISEDGFENAPDGTESDSVAMNGIFDVYIRLAKEDGSGETKHLLTTIKSGESFYFEEENDHGLITVKINGQAIESRTIEDSTESYFKFGNYHQAQNPETEEKLASGNADNDYAAFYAQYFSTSEITFTEMSYIRTLD